MATVWPHGTAEARLENRSRREKGAIDSMRSEDLDGKWPQISAGRQSGQLPAAAPIALLLGPGPTLAHGLPALRYFPGTFDVRRPSPMSS